MPETLLYNCLLDREAYAGLVGEIIKKEGEFLINHETSTYL